MWGLCHRESVLSFEKSRRLFGFALDYIRLSPAEYPLFATPSQGAVTLACALVLLPRLVALASCS